MTGATPAYDRLKRVLDVAVAGLALVATAPVQAGVAVAVWRNLGRPVLFRQPRPGKDGRLFTLVKFRTMLAPDAERGLLSDADRLTPFGRWLRSTSLDELPTLWNVLLGDMSLVGPRPLLVEYLDRYTSEQARRHEVRPGVTGLSQIKGRNSLSWTQKLDYDVVYVDRRSWSVDIAILVATVWSVLSRAGVSAPGCATMPEFHPPEERNRLHD